MINLPQLVFGRDVILTFADYHVELAQELSGLLRGSLIIDFSHLISNGKRKTPIELSNMISLRSNQARLDYNSLLTAKTVFTFNDTHPVCYTMLAGRTASALPIIGVIEGLYDINGILIEPGRSRNYANVDALLSSDPRVGGKDIPLLQITRPDINYLFTKPVKTRKKITVNVNFAYGINTHLTQSFLSEVMEGVKQSGQIKDVVVSVHPATVLDSDAYEQYDTASLEYCLENSEILVTRFSTAIWRAMALGVHVIYYDLEGADLVSLLGSVEGVTICKSPNELADAIRGFRKTNMSVEEVRQRHKSYLKKYAGLGEPIEKKALETWLKKHSLDVPIFSTAKLTMPLLMSGKSKINQSIRPTKSNRDSKLRILSATYGFLAGRPRMLAMAQKLKRFFPFLQ